MIQKKPSILITNCFYSNINRTVVIPDYKFHLEIWNPEFVICNSVMASGASPCNFKVESH